MYLLWDLLQLIESPGSHQEATLFPMTEALLHLNDLFLRSSLPSLYSDSHCILLIGLTLLFLPLSNSSTTVQSNFFKKNQIAFLLKYFQCFPLQLGEKHFKSFLLPTWSSDCSFLNYRTTRLAFLSHIKVCLFPGLLSTLLWKVIAKLSWSFQAFPFYQIGKFPDKYVLPPLGETYFILGQEFFRA